MKIGELVKQLRVKKGMTQEELASKTDISVRTIQRIESGDVDPRAYTLQSIAAALEIEYEMLAGDASSDEDGIKEKGERWLAIVHLSGLLLLIVPTLVLWIWKRDQVGNIHKHAADALNFQLSMTLYLLPCVLFSIYPFLILIAVYSQVIVIVNTVKVINRRSYKYPLTIRFLK